MEAPVPVQKNVVLVGAGNAHLRFVKMFAMRPMPGVAVTLISEASVIPYSAMVPGHIGGSFSWDEITIDLVQLCRAANVRFIAARVTQIDAAGKRILFESRPELKFDVACLGLGSAPARPAALANSDFSWPMRPLGKLIDRLTLLESKLRASADPFHLVVVGGGASGCELTLAIRKRFAAFAHFRVTLLHAGATLLPTFPAKAGAIFGELMQQQGVTVRCGMRVTGGESGSRLVLDNGETLTCDAVLWATNAAPTDLLHSAGLRLSADGFLLVHDTLQSLTDPAIFGTGDCITFENYPDLLKNGVYAVREGGVLFDNVWSFLNEKPLEPFKPQWLCLTLLNTSDGDAVFLYGPLVWKGGLVRGLKDRIDRQWMHGFKQLKAMGTPAPGEPEPPTMRCGGCGNKISSDVLSAVLKRLDAGSDPRVILGAKEGEDASVHRVRPELFGNDPDRLVEVQTVDYFKAFIDDPYLFGRVAALNSVSDLYAMNARPFSALAIATLPYARGPVQEGMLFELLSGAIESLKKLGVILTGGHTTEGPELALGFAVTGYAEEDRLFRKSKLRAGQRLILTKPLGSGALLAAWMRGECPARWFDPLVQTLLLANDRAGAIFAEAGVEACTDVTGFGLAGHLVEMLDASKVGATLFPDRVPIYAGFDDVVKKGIVSTLHGDNAKALCRVEATSPPAWLFDPQTSGGLIAAVDATVADDVVHRLIDAGCERAAVVGEVVNGPATIRLA